MHLLNWIKDISLSDTLTIIAIVISPIVALWLQKKMERRGGRKERKLDILRDLMATRAKTVSFKHVKALNMIDIEFYHDRAVISSWEIYRDHLNSYPKDGSEVDQKLWNKDTIENLAKLLFEIAKHLGYDFNEVLLKKGAYIPTAHSLLNAEQALIRRGCVELLNGKRALKIEPAVVTQNESQHV